MNYFCQLNFEVFCDLCIIIIMKYVIQVHSLSYFMTALINSPAPLFLTCSWHQKRKPRSLQFSNSRIQITERALQKPLFKDVLFLIIIFKNILSLVFHFKDILQYIKFVNW